MGYTIKIGNATPWHEKEDEGLRAGWRVDLVTRDDAPAFGDPTDKENQRWPSYSGWSDAMSDLGLHDLFFDKWEGLMSSHPGCAPLKPEHLIAIKAANEARKLKTGGKPAGFWDEPEVDNGNDPSLARGVWLEYWVSWALDNCETPAIENS